MGASNQDMPPAREFGWALKPITSSRFEIRQRENGQFTVVLNHALLRGVRAEMLTWWFQRFPDLTVRLPDTPGYEGRLVPGYWLWHPSDHLGAALSGPRAADGGAMPGCTKIHVQEAMQYLRYGWKYPVDAKLTVFYRGADGWAMGKTLPLLGPLMMLRIHFKDVVEAGAVIGAHYHYEVVIGLSGGDPISRFINGRIAGEYGPEFFEAWQTHNVVEVGVFENFLPALWAQRDAAELVYERSMDPQHGSEPQTSRDPVLFEQRVERLAEASNSFEAQAYDKASFL